MTARKQEGTTVDAGVARICQDVREQVDKRADRSIVGERFYRALLAEELISTVVRLGSFMDADTIRTVVKDGYAWLNETAPLPS